MPEPFIDEGDFETVLDIIREKDPALSDRFEVELRSVLLDCQDMNSLAMLHLSNDRAVISDPGMFPEILVNDVYFVSLFTKELGSEGVPSRLFVLDFTDQKIHIINIPPATATTLH